MACSCHAATLPALRPAEVCHGRALESLAGALAVVGPDRGLWLEAARLWLEAAAGNGIGEALRARAHQLSALAFARLE